MKRFIGLAALLPVALLSGACATLTRGTTEQFVIESTPAGAAVKTSHGFTCPATPCTFSLQRKEPFTVTVSKDGFVTQTAEVKSEVAGGGAAGMAGNVLLGGLIGIGVDATSGALNDLSPNPLQVVLLPVPAQAAAEPAPAPQATPQATPGAGAGS